MGSSKKVGSMTDYARRSTPDADKYPQKQFIENAHAIRENYDIPEINRRMNFSDDMKREGISSRAVDQYNKGIDRFAKKRDRLIDSYNPKRYVRRGGRK